MRIREGDPLEIYTNNDGEVIFKKYSPIGEISSFAAQYADVLHKTGGLPTVVCDRDHVIAVSGAPKKELMERRVSHSLEDAMEARKNIVMQDKEEPEIRPVEGVDRHAVVCAPIISAGDVCGSVMFVSSDEETRPSDAQVKLIQAAASFLGKQMEQ